MKLNSKILLFLLLIISANGFAQRVIDGDTTQPVAKSSYWKWTRHGNLYFAWGYNKEWYTKSDIHINTNISGEKAEYTLWNVNARDHIGWDELFHAQLTIPQYNYRIGYFFNKTQDLGVELSFDHTKFVVISPQTVHISGTSNGVAFDSTAHLYPDSTYGPKPFYYQLNNGANFFFVSLMKKFQLYKSHSGKIDFSYIAKGGVGWCIPHVQNVIFGNYNDPHFQFGGWDVSVESALRCVFFKYVYLDFAQRGTYASYSHLRIAGGLAKQNFGCYELILTLGLNIPQRIKAPTHGD